MREVEAQAELGSTEDIRQFDSSSDKDISEQIPNDIPGITISPNDISSIDFSSDSLFDMSSINGLKIKSALSDLSKIDIASISSGDGPTVRDSSSDSSYDSSKIDIKPIDDPFGSGSPFTDKSSSDSSSDMSPINGLQIKSASTDVSKIDITSISSGDGSPVRVSSSDSSYDSSKIDIKPIDDPFGSGSSITDESSVANHPKDDKFIDDVRGMINNIKKYLNKNKSSN